MIQSGLDAVIVSWNAEKYLERCLSSLQNTAASDSVSVGTVVVVDNDSADDSIRVARATFPGLRVLENRVNQGFGFACNQGARLGSGEYILFLNPDTKVLPGSLAGPLRFLESADGSAYGVCGVQLIDEEGAVSRSCARFPDAAAFWNQLLGLSRLAPTWFPGPAMTDWDHRSSRAVDHVIGAFYIIRRQLFENLGGFDERFFIYLEDLDLSLRAAAVGQSCYFLSDCRAMHTGGGTSEKVRAKRLAFSLMARWQYIRKNLSAVAGCLLAVGMILFEPLIRLAATAGRAGWRETIAGYRLLAVWTVRKFRHRPARLPPL